MQVLSLPTNEQLPSEVAERLAGLPPINVYRMIANAPQLLIPWTDMVKGLYDSKVDIRYREIAILRQASIAKSAYELHQHKFIAGENGINDDEIAIICAEGPVTALNEVENLVCKMAEELESKAGVSKQTMGALQKHFDTQELIELVILTSFYCCVARVLNSTRVEIEKDNPLQGSVSPN